MSVVVVWKSEALHVVLPSLEEYKYFRTNIRLLIQMLHQTYCMGA